METVLIAGGTGTIGTRLTQLLALKGYKIIVLTRDAASTPGNDLCEYSSWNPGKQEIDEEVLAKTDYIINLVGAGIADKRWTTKRKKVIVDSRVDTSRFIVKVLQKVDNKVKAVINASAIGFYGPDQGINGGFTETDPAADDFLAATCEKWEAAIVPVANLNKRLVIIRTGVVLARNGGIYKEFKMPLHFRVATVLGSGQQMVSWIHIDDICRVYIHAIENKNMQGVYNASAPHPVTIKEFVLTMARKKYGKYFLPLKIPGFLLRMALGKMAEVMLLKGTTTNADKLVNSPFSFNFSSLESAVENLESVSE